METNSKRVWLIGLAVIVSIVFGMWVFSPTEVVVTGVGRVSVPVTSASFNVSLAAVNDSPEAALLDLRTKVNNVKKTLEEMNIKPENVTETQVALTPTAALIANAKGYQATVTITVKITNVPVVADMVVKMYGAGATVVSQPVAVVEDQEKLEQEAISEAMVKAKQGLRATIGLRPIRKIVGIEQASSGNVATTTKIDDNKGTFEVVRAVSLTYRVW